MQKWSRNNVDDIILVSTVIFIAMPLELVVWLCFSPPTDFLMPEELIPPALLFV